MPASVFRLALPPSLGVDGISDAVSALRDMLGVIIGAPADVTVSQTYEVMTRNLLSGAVDAAWAPPFVCAKGEAEGLSVLVQAVRLGHAEYAAAFVARRGEKAPLASFRGKRVVWVDPYSVAGYLLPVAHLERRGLSAEHTFDLVGFAGSYRAALQAVADGKADLTCIHAHPTDDKAVVKSLRVHFPDADDVFDVVEVTEAVPADGVILRPEHDGLRERLQRGLLSMAQSKEGQRVLEKIFLAERFAVPVPGAYRALHRVAPR